MRTQTLYMLQSDHSRTGTRRDYRLFTVIGESIRDVTRETCNGLGTSYNPTRNLYSVSGTSPTHDRDTLQRLLGTHREVIRL
jgi:hypothetical protein